jgi:hypothetical protein
MRALAAVIFPSPAMDVDSALATIEDRVEVDSALASIDSSEVGSALDATIEWDRAEARRALEPYSGPAVAMARALGAAAAGAARDEDDAMVAEAEAVLEEEILTASIDGVSIKLVSHAPKTLTGGTATELADLEPITIGGRAMGDP